MLTQSSIPTFTLAKVSEDFTGNEIHKAKSLAQNGHVNILSIKPSGELDDTFSYKINASVVGSRGYEYGQEIHLYYQYANWEVEGNCGCPMHYNCKHVAAVLCLLETEKRLQPTTTKPAQTKLSLEQWLQSLGSHFNKQGPASDSGATLANTPATRKPMSEVLAYSLDTDSQGQWEVAIYKTRRLKSGLLSQAPPKDMYLRQLTSSLSANYIDADYDPGIIGCLESCRIANNFSSTNERNNPHFNPFRYSSMTKLQGDLGFTALRKMLASQRVFLGNLQDARPLRLGKEQSINPQWQLADDGSQDLTLCDQYTLDAIIPVAPLMGLDQQQAVLFPLITELNLEQLQQLLHAPTINPQESQKLSKHAGKLFEHSNLPAPQSIKIKQRKRKVKPAIQLLLTSSETTAHSPSRHLIKLRFAYLNGDPIAYHQEGDELSHWHEGTLHKTPRHHAAEQAAFKQLHDLGVRPMDALYPQDISPEINHAAHGLGLPSLSAWHAFLDKELPALETAGWTVDIDDHFNLEFVDADDWYADLDADSENDWFSLGIGIQVEGEAVNLLPVLLQSLAGVDLAQHLQYLRDNPDAKLPIQLDDGRYVTLPNERVLPLLETFVELFDDSTQLDELGRLSLAKSQAGRLAVISGDDWCWSGGDKLRKLAQKIANFSGIKTVKPPKSFKGKLRDYQQQGLNWLQFLREYELGGILADDMGLGKTVQTLAHLCCEKAAGRLQKPSLIIAPTSLVGNWKKEAARFAPKLKVLALQGPERKHQFEAIAEQDLVITTYALLKFDDAVLSQHDYSFLILDEAQNIKNPKSKSSQWVRDCPAEHKLCLTGTPMENHLGELWSLYDFLMPGLLGKSDEFTRLYRTPIEKHGDSEKHALLVKRIAPFLLRRDKQTVATELPKKTEISRCVELTGKQRDLYETIRLSMHKKVQQEIAKKGLGRSHIMILDALLKLRQVCCHPQLLKLDSAKKIQQSNKLDMLMEMLPEMIEEGRRILLFSQFTSMLTLIEKELHKKKIDYVKLTGQTRKRDEVINQFQNHEAPLFLISLKAGGVGLNLTAADTVIHFDPWWNPAVEDQATDRAYRIGQDKPVFVYKLTTENTVEAKILGMQERKRQLAEGTYGKQTQRKTAITEDDLKELFKPL